MIDIHCYFRLRIQKSLYPLNYLHCYFRLYTKDLYTLSYSLILLKAEHLCEK